MTLRWIKVDNESREQPASGSYSNWKVAIAKDCGERCVYCGIQQCRYYGIDQYHVEHFKPKKQFPDLEDQIENLFLACAICNRFKGADWIDKDHVASDIGEYASPAIVDFNKMFTIDETFALSSTEPIGRYMITRIFLNRPQLVSDRRRDRLQLRMKLVCEYLSGAIDELEQSSDKASNELVVQIAKAFARLHKLRDSLDSSSPYEPSDIKRKK